MTAEAIARELGARKTGTGWMARCPAHADRAPSLSIGDGDGGKVLIRCHAGCDQRRVIAALRARGLWGRHGRDPGRASRRPEPDWGNGDPPNLDGAERTEVALRLWRASSPAPSTPVETYLAARGLRLPPPPTLRCHPGLKHPSGGTWPTMVALVTRGADGTPLAIHRTFLALHGAAKAPLDPAKMMLGPCRGGVVRLADPDAVLMVGEGIETCLAAMQATGHPAWAALSTAGLRALDLPQAVREVIVLADGDDPGEAAARECAWRWKRESRRVRIARPPRGMDFNDLLMGHARRIEEGAP
jgi:hypothetical protein